MSAAGRPILFVAREPDETLRAFLPILAELRRRGRACAILFHHQPGAWARERLAELGVPLHETSLPDRDLPPGPWRLPRLAAPLGELRQLWRTRRLANRWLDRLAPSAVVVIQDTLLLERFLVREANRRGLGTLVVQWAFTYPQAMYDRLHAIKRGGGRETEDGGRETEGGGSSRPRSGLRTQDSGLRTQDSAYLRLQRALGVRFDLVNSYGGGEARVFAVMGQAFKEQFLAQGVRKERIEVTGHPLHDQAFRQRQELTAERAAELRVRYGLPADARIVLYATQPVLWRAVVTPEELVANVRALGRAVAALGPEFLLVLKLHPRETLDQYAAALTGDLPIRAIKDAEIAELIAPAEAFISSSSSTVLLAMMLDKPIVTVNFNQVPHFDYYESIGGTLHVRSPAAAAEALRRALFDQPTRAGLAEQRAAVLARYARFDGRATERLADLVEALAAGQAAIGT